MTCAYEDSALPRSYISLRSSVVSPLTFRGGSSSWLRARCEDENQAWAQETHDAVIHSNAQEKEMQELVSLGPILECSRQP